jgi:hypothetical protein
MQNLLASSIITLANVDWITQKVSPASEEVMYVVAHKSKCPKQIFLFFSFTCIAFFFLVSFLFAVKIGDVFIFF